MKTRLIFDFSDLSQILRWRPVNDVIMGGMSSGSIHQCGSAYAVFSGFVSLEQGGGFASVRTLPGDYDLERFREMVLSVKGDGKRYKINITDDSLSQGILHQARFQTRAGEWMEIHIPFADFVPTYRGRQLDNHKRLDKKSVRTFGLMISEGQAGEFSLDVASIGVGT